ncbi:MAG: hypothetical protein GWN00_07385, partial [Aliifodinibius sp.]|nr:trypsin-like peptidase domain-containing protein [Fodinibius sp.]NIV11051.1 hypothetical protein [Fodinibius sp.]NIY24638.1 hypothetical protein [Fodinibius sp.]
MTHDKLPSEIDGEYDIAYSYQGDRKALVKVLNSVRLLNSTAYYESHAFSQEEALIEADIVDDIPFEKSSEQFVFQDFAVGTATIIYFRATRLAVLTCAHVIDFPDTLISYYDVTNVGDQRFIENISIKKKHTNNLTDLRYGDELKVLAIDRDLDLAILGKRFKSSQTRTVPVFNVPLGTAKELTWGNIVFVLGFPGGKKMVTTGIVSSPNRTGEHHFLLDALFNRGLSGGIVLAIRDGIPNFELVGVVNSVAAESEIVLAPHRLAGQN